MNNTFMSQGISPSLLDKMNKSPPTPEELESVETMTAMMGGGISAEVALNVLRKHNGDVDKAASALLEGDLGDSVDHMDVSEAGTSGLGPRTPPPSKPEGGPPVIDLTKDDEDKELSRALKASLEDQGPKFGPSNRAPDANWAMVPSNLEVGSGTGVSQEDHSLSRAIEASLKYSYEPEVFEELPIEEKVRKDGRPVALRPTEASLNYAALILHGLFYIPQVRHTIARWRPPPDTIEAEDMVAMPPTSGPKFMMWSLLEIFANMDLAMLSELSVDAAIAAFAAEHWSTPVERPGDVSFVFYSKLAWSVELALHEVPTDVAPSWPSRLFHFRYGFSDADLSQAPFDRRFDLSVVKVDVRGTEDRNDLMSCLSAELGLAGSGADASRQQVIFEPSDVVAFQLIRDSAPPSYEISLGVGKSAAKTERTTFVYPKYMYLDQFLKENVSLATEKRDRQRSLNEEIERLASKKVSLMRHNDRDTLVDLRSSLHYYEHVAEDYGDPQRKSLIESTAMKLRKTLARIENELQTIDATISKLKVEAAEVFGCPELQRYRYNLRVVLVHDGLYGRNHLYSYVKQKDIWWKTADYVVTEESLASVAEDTVLSDPVGLHLGAGPYFLIYSRALSEDDEDARAPWPEDVKNSVKHNNHMFLLQLPAEVAAQVSDPNSPPTSPYHSMTPSDYTVSSGIVEPPLSREEPMDLVD